MKKLIVVTITLAIFAVLGNLFSTPTARAATLTVSSLDDTGAGTLRDAITNAIAGDTIDFSVSGTIVLASNLPDIDKRLTIDGAGQTVTLQGQNSVRSGFELLDGANLTLRNITFDQGNAGSGNGGAIYADGSAVNHAFPIKLHIENSIFTNNETEFAGRDGGAISIKSVDATITDSTFDGNLNVGGSGEGGAIYARSSALKVTRSTFHDNVAGGSGGAIYITQSAELAVTESTFTSNDANGTGTNEGGGAIMINSLQNGSATLVSGVPPVISGSYFGFNTSDSDGGAIRIQPRGVTIHNSTFYQNSALGPDEGSGPRGQGGAIYAWGAQISQVTAERNTATQRGGGVYLIFSNTRVDNSILGNNTPDDCAASSSDFILVRDSLVEKNSPEIDGMTDYNCNVEAANGNILNDDPELDAPADNGGATFTMKLQNPGGFQDSPAIDAGNPLTCSVADQRGRLRTGGLCDMGAYELNSTVSCAAHDGTTEYVSADSSALQNAINSAPVSGTVKMAGTCTGGATTAGTIQTVYIDKSVTLEGGYNILDWATAADPAANPTILDGANIGRVVYVNGGHTVRLEGLTLQNGLADPLSPDGQGGGVYLASAGTLMLNQLEIVRNRANLGGGVFVTDGTVTLEDVTVADNSASNRGAGLYANQGHITVEQSALFNNAAGSSGGVHIVGATTIVRNSTFSSNRAFRGAALQNLGGTLTLNHVTIANNEGTGAVADSGISNLSVMTMTNSIVAYTVGMDDCGTLGSGTSFIRNTLIEDGSCGITNSLDGNKTGDPELYALAFMADRGSSELDDNGAVTKSHELRSGSPVIGGGSPSYCTSLDQIGFARGGGTCDMGARETDGVPTAVAVSEQLSVISYQAAVLGLIVVLLATVTVWQVVGQDRFAIAHLKNAKKGGAA